jgi:hypothetical protein
MLRAVTVACPPSSQGSTTTSTFRTAADGCSGASHRDLSAWLTPACVRVRICLSEPATPDGHADQPAAAARTAFGSADPPGPRCSRLRHDLLKASSASGPTPVRSASTVAACAAGAIDPRLMRRTLSFLDAHQDNLQPIHRGGAA